VVVEGEVALSVELSGERAPVHVVDLYGLEILTPGPLLDLKEICTAVGKTIGKLMLIAPSAYDEYLGPTVWILRCACGKMHQSVLRVCRAFELA
jgi:hypothetical protein